MKVLIAIPVYNEQKYVAGVLEKVRRYADDVLVIDDGSTDQTPVLLARQPVEVIRHAQNRGYGQCMIDAFRWSMCYRYDWLITMDCDEQHEPESLPDFYDMIERTDADVISGSRYLSAGIDVGSPPADRRRINRTLTGLINDHLGFSITDAFCGFKAYRVKRLSDLDMRQTGYAFPLQFWVQAAAADLNVSEMPVRLIYNDPNRSFGDTLDETENRLRHYLQVFNKELAKYAPRFGDASCVECAVEELKSDAGDGSEDCSHLKADAGVG